MELSFVEFAQLVLLAIIAYSLVHSWIDRELRQDERGAYWPMFLVFMIYLVAVACLMIGMIWGLFVGLNWAISMIYQ